MDRIDKDLLNRMQKGFPLSGRPFLVLGRELGISEGEALERTARLKEEGYIRRIGGVFHTPGLGFYSTLVAARVVPEKLEGIAEQISGWRGVTHNYERDGDFNLWFTLTAQSEAEADAVLQEVAAAGGVEKLMKLPALRRFKVELNLFIE